MKLFCFKHIDISEEQIREELKAINGNSVDSQDTDTYEIWMSFAENWFSDPDEIYETLRCGFRGFLERQLEDILQDFEINCDEVKEIKE